MLQVLQKWSVRVVLQDGAAEQTIWLHDDFLSNVLGMLSKMQFSESGLSQPLSITVTRVDTQDAIRISSVHSR